MGGIFGHTRYSFYHFIKVFEGFEMGGSFCPDLSFFAFSGLHWSIFDWLDSNFGFGSFFF